MIEQLVGPLEIEFLVNMFIGMICGFIIGAERELKKKPAGVRTQTLVIIGAMIFTFLSVNVVNGDPGRIAAQIVTGIGFLGAGIILKTDNGKHIRNVTTAASIWYSAAVGMAIGFELYVIALTAALFAVLISRLPSIDNLLDE